MQNEDEFSAYDFIYKASTPAQTTIEARTPPRSSNDVWAAQHVHLNHLGFLSEAPATPDSLRFDDIGLGLAHKHDLIRDCQVEAVGQELHVEHYALDVRCIDKAVDHTGAVVDRSWHWHGADTSLPHHVPGVQQGLLALDEDDALACVRNHQVHGSDDLGLEDVHVVVHGWHRLVQSCFTPGIVLRRSCNAAQEAQAQVAPAQRAPWVSAASRHDAAQAEHVAICDWTYWAIQS